MERSRVNDVCTDRFKKVKDDNVKAMETNEHAECKPQSIPFQKLTLYYLSC